MFTKIAKTSLDVAADAYFKDKSDQNLEILVQSGSRLVHHFVRVYGMQNSYEDLVQVGTEGLLKALKRYNAQIGVTFTTYAGSVIIGEIRHYVRKEAAYYRPKVVAALQEKANMIIEDRFTATGEIPSLNSIAANLNIREEGIGEIMKTGLVPIDEVDLSKITSARHESFKLPIEDRIILNQAMDKLTELQRRVIDMLFFKDMTQSQAAIKLDINRKKVSRELQKGIDSLKKDLV